MEITSVNKSPYKPPGSGFISVWANTSWTIIADIYTKEGYCKHLRRLAAILGGVPLHVDKNGKCGGVLVKGK